MQDLFDK